MYFHKTVINLKEGRGLEYGSSERRGGEKESTQIERYQMASTHVRAHHCSPIAVEQTSAFSPANASLPFLWLSTIDLFCCPPCYEGTGRRARPPIFLCLAHILYSFCFLFYFLFVILPPSV